MIMNFGNFLGVSWDTASDKTGVPYVLLNSWTSEWA